MSNHYFEAPQDPKEQQVGYTIRRMDGSVNLKKFYASLDYSLDLIKLREVYEAVYRNTRFSWTEGIHEYTQQVINVTFDYSVQEWNRARKDVFVKFGYDFTKLSFVDGLAWNESGEVVGITVNTPVKDTVGVALPSYFWKEEKDDGSVVYKAKVNIKTVMTLAELRNDLYHNGFWCDGKHYVRWKRSSGSARVGKCLFINELLYRKMHRWEMCGITVRKGQNVDLASLEAYIALTLSSIIDTVEIAPENILVVDDWESEFEDKVIATEMVTDKNGSRLITSEKATTISNSIWDGMSLIDTSLMGTYKQYGMLLLRNRFFKTCAFHTRISDWMRDHGITSVSQLNGFTLAKRVEDIKLITTPSSIKYLKFGSVEKWLEMLEPLFGIVKHEKKTHYFDGRMVQCHYQLLNTLHMSKDEVAEFLEPSMRYYEMLKTDPAVVRYHIKYPGQMSFAPMSLLSKNDIVYKLVGLNEQFTKTKLYDDFVSDLTKSFIKNLKQGHVYIDGNYSTLLGNPVEMLQQAIGEFEGESVLGAGNVHSMRFPYGTTILGSRSPHVCMGNIWLAQNVENELIDKYFCLTPEIICVNAIGENLLQRLSGCDYDSDTAMITDNPILIRAAQRHYDDFGVPTNLVSSTKTKRTYTEAEQADLDIKTSVNLIGDIVNLSQELNTLYWHSLNHGSSMDELKELYYDICQLDVMSGIEINVGLLTR